MRGALEDDGGEPSPADHEAGGAEAVAGGDGGRGRSIEERGEEAKNPIPSALFTKQGHCVIQLVDVTDIVEAKKKTTRMPWQRKETERHIVFASISVRDESDYEVNKYCSRVVGCAGGETIVIKEEFVFEAVTSNHSVVIALNIMTLNDKTDPFEDLTQRRLGSARIPFSRLEENRPSVQWYQLVDSANEGIRTAVRAKVTFVVDSSQKDKDRRRSSTTANPSSLPCLAEGDESSVQSLRLLQQAMHASTHPLELQIHSDSQHSDGHCGSGDGSPMHVQVDGPGSPLPPSAGTTATATTAGGGRRMLIPDPEAALAPGTGTTASATPIGLQSIPCGIVDYCIVLGPEHPQRVRPTHCLRDGHLRRLRSCSDFDPSCQYGASPAPTSEEGSSGTGLFSPQPSQPQYSEDVALWDRLPVQDLADFELPSKIEWFACPEGCVTVASPVRPEPFTLTFMLNAGMETSDILGLCFNFFVEVGDNQDDSCADDGESAVDTSAPWSWDTESAMHSNPSTGPRRNWTAVTICILMRSPFLQPLAACMHHAYAMSVQPCIEQWEAARRARSSPDEVPFPACHLPIEQLLAFLFLECPMPVPGLLSITAHLATPSDSLTRLPVPTLAPPFSSHGSSSVGARRPSRVPSLPPLLVPGTPLGASPHTDVTFRLPAIYTLPECSMSIFTVLQLFGPRTMVDIAMCVMSEARLLFHSTSLSTLHLVCEVFRTLMYPLKWTHVYLPVVPRTLLNLVEAPVPYMLGTHSDWIESIHADYLHDVILVDCDSGALDYASTYHSIIKLPHREDRWLVMALTHIYMHPHIQSSKQGHEYSPMSPVHHIYAPQMPQQHRSGVTAVAAESAAMVDKRVQVVFYDLVFHLLRFVPECLFYLNPSCPVFNRPLFLSEYTPDEYKACMLLLTATNAFHELTESLRSDSLGFFVDCVDHYADLERTVLGDQDASPTADGTSPGQGSGSTMGSGMGSGLVSASASASASSFPLRPPASPAAPPSRGLTRNVSVASIIFDKISIAHSASTPLVGSPAPCGQADFADSPTDMGDRSSSKTNVPFSRVLAKQPSMYTSKPFGRTVSFLHSATAPMDDLRTSPAPTPLSPMMVNQFSEQQVVSVGAGAGAAGAGAGAHHEDSLHLLLPPWVFNPRGHNDVVAPRSLDIDGIVFHRVQQYVLITQQARRRRRRGGDTTGGGDGRPPSLSPPIADLGMTIDRQVYQLEEQCAYDLQITMTDVGSVTVDPMGGKAAGRRRLSALAAFSTDEFGPPATDGRALHLTRKRSFSDPNSFLGHLTTAALPIVTFDPQKVVATQQKARDWNMETLAEYFHLTPKSLDQQFREARALLGSTATALPQGGPGGSGHRGSVLLGATTAADTVQRFQGAKGPVSYHIDDCLLKYLRSAVVDGMKGLSSEARHTVNQALESPENRKGLIGVLKSAKDDKRNQRIANVYPLNESAFSAFLELFFEFLGICSAQRDYIQAFALLEVAGQYFRVLHVVPGEEEVGDGVEFLSEKICIHPIFMTTALWRALLQDRMLVEERDKGALSPVAAQKRKSKDPSGRATDMSSADMRNEVHSLLYIMQSLGVNSVRALDFLRGVASDFSISIDEYYKLQHFAQDLYAQEELTPRPEPQQVPEDAAPVPPPASRKLTRDTPGGASRRLSQSGINDIIVKQGHTDKLIVSTRSKDVNSFYDDPATGHSTTASFFWGKTPVDETLNPSAADGPLATTLSSRSLSKSQSTRSPHGNARDALLTSRGVSMGDELTGVDVTVTTDEGGGGSGSHGLSHVNSIYIDKRSPEVMTLQGWDDQNLSALLAPSSSSPSAPAHLSSRRVLEGGAGSCFDLRLRVKQDCLYREHALPELEGLFGNTCTAVRNFLCVGCRDGMVTVLDSETGTLAGRWKHSNAGGVGYHGVTALVALDGHADGGDGFLFSGCSQGAVKIWTVPRGHAHASGGGGGGSEGLRGKQATAVVKGLNGEVTALSAHFLAAQGQYLVACADAKGDVLVARGDATHPPHLSALGGALRASHAAHTHVPFGGGGAARGEAGGLLGGADPAVTSLALVSLSGPATAPFAPFARGRSAPPTVPMGAGGGSDWCVALGTRGGGIGVVDVTSGTPLFFAGDAHSGPVTSVQQLRPHEFVSCGADRSIKVWDIRMRNKGPRALGSSSRRGGFSPITSLALGGQDNTLVISACADGMAKLWDLRYDLHAPCSEIRAHKHRISQVVWQDRAAFHTVSYDGSLRSWDSIHGSSVRILPIFEMEGIERVAMGRPVFTTPAAGKDAADEASRQHTSAVALGWSGAIKFFSYDSTARP